MGNSSLFVLELGCSLPDWASLSSPCELTDCSKSSKPARSTPRPERSSCVLASLNSSIERPILKQLHRRYGRLLPSLSDFASIVARLKAAAGAGRDAPTTAPGRRRYSNAFTATTHSLTPCQPSRFSLAR